MIGSFTASIIPRTAWLGKGGRNKTPPAMAGGEKGRCAYSWVIKVSAMSTVCMCSSIRTTMLL